MMSRDAFEHLVSKHARAAAERCPSDQAEEAVSSRATPYGRDAATPVGGGSLGDRAPAGLEHESLETTQGYLAADMAMKERALAKTAAPRVRTGRFRPGDRLL